MELLPGADLEFPVWWRQPSLSGGRRPPTLALFDKNVCKNETNVWFGGGIPEFFAFVDAPLAAMIVVYLSNDIRFFGIISVSILSDKIVTLIERNIPYVFALSKNQTWVACTAVLHANHYTTGLSTETI